MPDIRRVGVLLLSQATRPAPIEDSLLRDDVVAYRPALSTPGANSTNIADLASGLRSFHKPLAGVDAGLAQQYGHDVLSVGLNECAAWRLARFLGSPYAELVPATVLRWHDADVATKAVYPNLVDGWGSLSSEQFGRPLDPTPLSIPSVNDPAGFFDALIAQQDRHVAQYRWDAAAGRLGLIDHGFAFARPGDPLNDSVFLFQRHSDGRDRLEQSEKDALDAIAGSRNLGGVGEILGADQVQALADRIARMRATGMLLSPGSW
jgi:hypothetical protein